MLTPVNRALAHLHKKHGEQASLVINKMNGAALLKLGKELEREERLNAFNPSQPRDKSGKWTSGGGSGGASNPDMEIIKRYKEEGNGPPPGATNYSEDDYEDKIDPDNDMPIRSRVGAVKVDVSKPGDSGSSFVKSDLSVWSGGIVRVDIFNPSAHPSDREISLEKRFKSEKIAKEAYKNFPKKVTISELEADGFVDPYDAPWRTE